MEYRYLGTEKVSVLGIGSGNLRNADPAEIERIIAFAADSGINFMDMVMSDDLAVQPVVRALRGRRSGMMLQLHFCATYPNHVYSRTRVLGKVQKGFTEELRKYETDYADVGMIHFIDSERDYSKVFDNGIVDYAVKLKKNGAIRFLGFSSHNPTICKQLLAIGIFDTYMLGINPAFDFEPKRGKLALSEERKELYQLSEKMGVGISVMKAFNGGQLLNDKTSPFGRAMTVLQCIQYALDRPGVFTCLAGVASEKELRGVLNYFNTTKEERDYAFIGSLPRRDSAGACVYCNHCLPCPTGIDIGALNKYTDLARTGDDVAADHYHSLAKQAHDCNGCGVCESRCPFGVDVRKRMGETKTFFSTLKTGI